MAFHFDFEALKKHPYAIGGAIIAGGLIIFYLLSRGGSSTSTSDGGVGEALSYDEQMAQVNAATSTANNQTQAQLAQSELEAQVSNTQTAASVDTQNTATEAQLATNIAGIVGDIYATNDQATNNADELVYAENIQDMQDSVLENQTNAAVYENANNNATALGSQEIGDNLYQNLVATLAPNFGKQYNSGGDLASATGLEETVLTEGNPGVATAGIGGVSSATTSGNAANVALATTAANSVSNLISSLL